MGSNMRILSYSELRRAKGIVWTRQHINRLERRGEFPRRVHIGRNTVGWLEIEINDFLAKRADAREMRPGEIQNDDTDDGPPAADG